MNVGGIFFKINKRADAFNQSRRKIFKKVLFLLLPNIRGATALPITPALALIGLTT